MKSTITDLKLCYIILYYIISYIYVSREHPKILGSENQPSYLGGLGILYVYWKRVLYYQLDYSCLDFHAIADSTGLMRVQCDDYIMFQRIITTVNYFPKTNHLSYTVPFEFKSILLKELVHI